MQDLTPQQVLDLPLDDNDAEAPTVRSYLMRLLGRLWAEGEGFSSKRPFGNSGWQYDLYVPLIKAEAISGSLDKRGYVEDCDDRAGDRLILAAIRSLETAP